MQVRIAFEEISEIEVKTISVIGSFNGYDAKKGILQKEENEWVTYVELGQGEHYYKFLINETIMLNDPTAIIYLPHREDGVWSVILINEHDERLLPTEQNHVNIEEYAVSSMQTSEEIAVNNSEPIRKIAFSRLFFANAWLLAIWIYKNRLYQASLNSLFCINPHGSELLQVVVRFGFAKVTGLHPVTVLWYDARGQLHEVTENMLYIEDEAEDMVYLWFWTEPEAAELLSREGNWTMKLFIDGQYVLTDQFSVSRCATYSRNSLQHNYI